VRILPLENALSAPTSTSLVALFAPAGAFAALVFLIFLTFLSFHDD